MLADSCLAEACVTFHGKSIHAMFRILTPYMYIVLYMYKREGVESVSRGRLRMFPIGCWSVMRGA